MYTIRCTECGSAIQDDTYVTACPRCGGSLGFSYKAIWDERLADSRSMWKYFGRLPLRDAKNIVSIGEGLTPLIESKLGAGYRLYLKDETRNPTGSVKDRPISVAVSKAKELGLKKLLAASTGSVGLSLAAYAAKAGLEALILVPRGTPRERLLPMSVFGAAICEVDGSYEDAMHWMDQAKATAGWYVASTYRAANPYQAEGPKTIAYEIFEDLGRSPDIVIDPIGGGGTLCGIWHGFKELKEMNLVDSVPRMIGVQVESYPAIKMSLERGLFTWEEVLSLGLAPDVPTVAVNLAHICPPDCEETLAAIRESGGDVVIVNDTEALQAQSKLARTDAVFCEPSSATAIAGFERLRAMGRLRPDMVVVAVITGAGFRESNTIARLHPLRTVVVSPKASFEEVVRCMGSVYPVA